MPHKVQSLMFLALLSALAGCSSVAIPYQGQDDGTDASWADLEESFTRKEVPNAPDVSTPARSSRAKILDHGMEMQVGGALFANFDTVLRFDSAVLGIGFPIDLESDLGFDDGATVFRLDLKYRLGERHRFEFSNFSITRRANWRLDKSITIGGEVYPININVSAALTTNIYKGSYRYLFAMGDTWDVSASFGLHTFGLGFAISEDAAVDRASSESFTLPLPVIGLGFNYAILDNLRFTALTELFGVEIKNFTGYLIDTRLNLDWDLWDHVGFGVGWNGFIMDVEVRDRYLGGDLLTGSFVYRYQGVLLYLRIFF